MRLSRPTLLLAALVPLAGPLHAQEIGTAGAVNPATTSTPPARPTRVLELGARVVFNERVTTTANGTAQLIFLDKTTINIGPNCDITINEYVYDPASNSGRMTATLTKGLLRFVGGATSHTGGAQIRTPVATIGIRGGIDTIEHRAETRVFHSFGEATVSNGVSTEVLRRPGSTTTVASPSTPVEPPRKATAAEFAALNSQLTSKPGQTGGSPAPVTAAAVQRADAVAPVLAQVQGTTLPVQAQTSARQLTGAERLALSVSPTDATSPTQVLQVTAATSRQVTAQTSQTLIAASQSSPAADGNANNPILPASPVAGGTNPPTTNPAGPTNPTTPTAPPFVAGPPARAYALQMSVDPSLGSQNPFLPAGFVSAGSGYVSPVLGYGIGGQNPDGTPNRTSRVLQGGLTVNGTGANQTSTLYVFAGNAYQSTVSGDNTFAGGFTATTLRASTSYPGRAVGGFIGTGQNVAFDGNYTPTSIRGLPGSTDPQDRYVAQSANYFPGNGSAPNNGNYVYDQTATAIATPAGLGQNRPTATLSGYANGLMRSVNQTTGTFAGATFGFEGTLVVNLDSTTSRFGTTIAGSNTTPSAGQTFSSATIPIGYQGTASQSVRGTYVDYNNFGGRESRNSPYTGPSLATVNGETVTNARAVFVTSDTVNAAGAFPNASFCRCEYTRWGFWSSETDRTQNGSNFQDLLHLGTWVAGQPTAVGAMPQTGTATYAGHAIATIQNGANQYTAAGNFANAVNFATGVGTATVSNLDGLSYAGSTQIQAGSNGFTGQLAAGNTTMQLQGQFGRGVSGPAGEMFGGLRITGTNYLGRGTFAGAAP